MERAGWFVLGIVATVVAIFVGGYLFTISGGVSMATTSAPLPFEQTVAKLALHADVKSAADLKDPLPFDDANMTAGATHYREHCAVCHGLPDKPSVLAQAMFPRPPQLLEPHQMVTDDPEGVTYWKITHGIRLSGMPGFEGLLSQTDCWQAAMFVAHADQLSPALRAALHP